MGLGQTARRAVAADNDHGIVVDAMNAAGGGGVEGGTVDDAGVTVAVGALVVRAELSEGVDRSWLGSVRGDSGAELASRAATRWGSLNRCRE